MKPRDTQHPIARDDHRALHEKSGRLQGAALHRVPQRDAADGIRQGREAQADEGEARFTRRRL